MSHETKLTGPDFAEGIASCSLVENVPMLGHAHGEAVILVRTSTGLRAVGANCSHYAGPLAQGLVVGETIRCPWHHACFDLRSGDALSAPALDALPCYEVLRHGDRVRVGAPMPRPARQAPPKNPARVVIVGAGGAGSAAAERLRHLGHTGSITLIGDEATVPVDRPNLSKDFLAGKAPLGWVRLRPRDFYEKIGIEFVADDAVVDLDVARSSVTLASASILSYDALLLATGAAPMRPPIPGADAPHVFTLRTLADAQRIVAAAVPGRRVVVVGSSFIGLEVAASLRARGLDVQVVSRDRAPLERVLGERVGRFIQGIHEAHGVRFLLGATSKAIRTDGVELQDGRTLPADLVLLGTGVRPRTALAERAGLPVDDGILVDSSLRTNAPAVWAAGDVARYPESRLGTTVRIEHWAVAQRQGQAAAADMLGLGKRFDAVPFFWSRHYDVSLRYVGHADGEPSITISGSLRDRDATVIYRSRKQGGRVTAVVTIGRDLQSLEIEAALERADDVAVEQLLRCPTPREGSRQQAGNA